MTLPPDLIHLLERAAAHPRGLAFLHLGPVESVAVALDVDARDVDRARASFEEPGQRAELLGEYRRAVERVRSSGEPARGRRGAAWRPPPSRGPSELVEAARAHPLGIPFLLEAPPETVAVVFGVHPRVVHAARELLACAGRARGRR